MEHSGQDPASQNEIKLIEIRRICAKNDIFLNDSSLGQLGKYVSLLVDWNVRINLISRKDIENIWEAHILHSLSILFEEPISSESHVLDLGSGGGLPGLPIAIARPDISMTLLDATRKKTDAVRSMAETLGTKNTRTIWGRAEDKVFLRSNSKSFDLVIARAVASLEDLVRWSKPLVRHPEHHGTQDAQLITLKGGNLTEEINKVRRMPGVKEVRSKALTFFGAERIPGIEKQIVAIVL